MKIKICIDASNIREGGGVTHLSELLNAASKDRHDIDSILIFAPQSTLDTILSKSWIIKKNSPDISKGILYRIYWQRFVLARLINEAECNILFVPGGSDVSGFHPVVSMSQNLLPFDWKQLKRYGISLFTVKMLMLRCTQSLSFRRSNGVIFLTDYARNLVASVVKDISSRTAIINHGIHSRFSNSPKKQFEISNYSTKKPFSIIYVSTIDMYKNQWVVAEAVARIKKSNIPVELKLIGSSREAALTKLQDCLTSLDQSREFIHYLGIIPFDDLHTHYAQADLMVFASSCENMPNILLEGMAAGLPIACSNLGPMPEILGDAGIYFNPENCDDVTNAIRTLVGSSEMRTEMSQSAYRISQSFSWSRCADETFSFLASVLKDYENNK